MPTLYSPARVGNMNLASRICMAPLTRNRASAGQVPNELMLTYYRQRANPATGAGLIITEATQISPMGQGYLDTPGIHSAEQMAGWRRITDAVHAEDGCIVVQLWHVGRISHGSLLPGGQRPVSSTSRAATTKTYIAGGFAPCSEPRALATEEMAGIVADYAQAARNAITAGFDGVEIHAANGYLIDQFLRDSINDRSDSYGGSINNRCRLLLEVVQTPLPNNGLIIIPYRNRLNHLEKLKKTLDFFHEKGLETVIVEQSEGDPRSATIGTRTGPTIRSASGVTSP